MTTAEKLDYDTGQKTLLNGAAIRLELFRDRGGTVEAFKGYQEFANGFKGYRLRDCRKKP